MSDDKFDAIVVGAGVAVALPHWSWREPGWMSW